MQIESSSLFRPLLQQPRQDKKVHPEIAKVSQQENARPRQQDVEIIVKDQVMFGKWTTIQIIELGRAERKDPPAIPGNPGQADDRNDDELMLPPSYLTSRRRGLLRILVGVGGFIICGHLVFFLQE